MKSLDDFIAFLKDIFGLMGMLIIQILVTIGVLFLLRAFVRFLFS